MPPGIRACYLLRVTRTDINYTTMKNSKIKQVQRLGQRIWLDSFNRDMLDSGKLKKMIEEDGITGITSNPSIFQKALINSTDYDADIRSLLQKKTNYEDLFFSLAVKDIQRACDL